MSALHLALAAGLALTPGYVGSRSSMVNLPLAGVPMTRRRQPLMAAPPDVGRKQQEEPSERLVSDEEDSKPRMPPAATGGGVAVFLLVALFTTNQWARQLIFYTVDFKAAASAVTSFQFMNVDIGFSEGQYGVLASIGFAALFSVTSLVAGGVVERVDTRNLLTATSVLWTGATVWQGTAHGFNEVLGSRMLSGVGQAFANPASYTILRRLYPKERLASVNGLYASGLYFGGGLAAFSVLLDESLGWRQLCFLVGALGLVAACAVQILVPPLPPLAAEGADAGGAPASPPADAQRTSKFLSADEEAAVVAGGAANLSPAASSTDSEQEETDALLKGGAVTTTAADGRAGVVGDLARLLAEPTVALLLLASAFRFLAGFTIGVWIVPFYRGRFPGSIGAEFAIIKSAVNGLAGSVSATGGGVLADKLAKRDPRAQFWVPALGGMLAIPFWLGTLGAPSLEASLGCLFFEYLLAECWFGPTVTQLQAAAPEGTQGLTTGVFSFLVLVGNFAPFLIGIAVQNSDVELTQLLGPSVAVLYSLSALAFVAAGQVGQPSKSDSAADGA